MKIDCIKNIIKQVFCWILLLQIVNISINPPDIRPKYSLATNKEDLSINKLESIYELVVESISDEEVPESDEDEIDTSSPQFVLFFNAKIDTKLPAVSFPIEHFAFYHNNFLSVHQEPHYPPPKLA